MAAAEQADNSIKSQASESTVTYITRHIVERQLGSDLADPYHLPVSEYSSHKEEVWITGTDDSLKTRMRKTDGKGNLLFDTQSVKVGDSVKVRINDLVKGVDVVAETTVNKAQSNRDSNTQGRWFEKLSDKEFRVSDLAQSDWKRGAWKIELERDIVNGDPSSLPDFERATDLNATKLKFVWVIDRDSSMLVRTESWAITNRGEVLLYEVKVDPPKTVDINSLPDDWFVVPTGTTTTDTNSQSSAGSASARQRAEVLYSPAPATLDLLGFEPFAPGTNVRTYFKKALMHHRMMATIQKAL